MKQAIKNLLVADATLMAFLTGGIYADVSEISRRDTKAAFDDFREIKPCCLVKLSNSSPFGPHHYSERLFFQLYFYQRHGYDSIEPARLRCYDLLHLSCVKPADGQTVWRIDHANDVLDQEDETIEAAMIMSRYVSYVNRNP